MRLIIFLGCLITMVSWAADTCDRSLSRNPCPEGQVCCLRDKPTMRGECSIICRDCGDQECMAGESCCRWMSPDKKVHQACRKSCRDLGPEMITF